MPPKRLKKVALTPESAYLAGVVTGDGHISAAMNGTCRGWKVRIDSGDREYLESVLKALPPDVITKASVRTRQRDGKRPYYHLTICNKHLYHFLNADLRIPNGAKSSSVRIPEPILRSPVLLLFFLAGYFDTDGGRRGGTIGYTSASREMMEDVLMALNLLGMDASMDSWLNKKYDRYYYGVRLKRPSARTFLKELPLLNEAKRFRCCEFVGVPERSNGLRLGRES